MPLKNFERKILAIDSFDIVRETMDIMKDNEEWLADRLRAQMALGLDAKNRPVTLFGRDEYRKSTIENKRENAYGLGKRTDIITNYMFGDFYAEIKLRVSGTRFIFDSSVPYYNDILKRSGNSIMQLNEENLRNFRNNILVPELRRRFLARLKQ